MKRKISTIVLVLFSMVLFSSSVMAAIEYPIATMNSCQESVQQGENLQIQFHVFAAGKGCSNQTFCIKFHQGSKDGPVVATYEEEYRSYRDEYYDQTMSVNTESIPVGTYYIEFYSKFYASYEWREAPDKYTYRYPVQITANNVYENVNTSNAVEDAFVTTIYAPDGRTAKVKTTEVKAYKAVGWNTVPTITVYSLDGNTINIWASEFFAYTAVGWYLGNTPLIMYAPDGRTILVTIDQMNAYRNVGWSQYPIAA